MTRVFAAGQHFFEDFAVGDQFVTAGATLSEGQILEFGLAWDPQPFHTDVEAARASIFGGLVASGFQTLALSCRLIMSCGVINACNLGGPALDEIRFPRPVKPGDTLTVTATFESLRASASRPDRGIAKIRYVTRNQRGEEVLSVLITHMLRRRAMG
ncbi:MAG: MaoC family dehydratase [Alphaproteobacteria bacterium]|nr:MaoC family dehydratase [Alphaproteobacteria bacterium]